MLLKQRLLNTDPCLLEAPIDFILFKPDTMRSASIDAFFKFIDRLRTHRSGRLIVDLTHTQRMHVSAALLFKAELSHQIARGCAVRGVAPTNERIRQVLQQTGLAHQLGLNTDTKVSREDVVHWRHSSGTFNQADPEAVDRVLANNSEQMGGALYRGTIESVANCAEHAYKEHHVRRNMIAGQDGWWVFQQIRDEEITVCVCDLGIGVANALPLRLADEPDLLKKLFHLFRSTKGEDRRAMLAAMEYGRTGTKKPHRGRGMRDLTDVIDVAGSGSFMWFSHRGLLSYNRKSKDAPPTKKTYKLARSIHGTICMWKIPVKLELSGDLETEEPS